MIAEKKKSLARNARVEGNQEGLLGEWKQIKNKKKERERRRHSEWVAEWNIDHTRALRSVS